MMRCLACLQIGVRGMLLPLHDFCTLGYLKSPLKTLCLDLGYYYSQTLTESRVASIHIIVEIIHLDARGKINM